MRRRSVFPHPRTVLRKRRNRHGAFPHPVPGTVYNITFIGNVKYQNKTIEAAGGFWKRGLNKFSLWKRGRNVRKKSIHRADGGGGSWTASLNTPGLSRT